MRHHVAVVDRRYVRLILSGRKRIECRILRRRVVPFDAVEPGDRIWFKPPSAPLCASACVTRVRWIPCEGPDTLVAVCRRFGRAICAERAFWARRAGARYVGLFWLGEAVPCEPIRIGKRDRRAWVVLSEAPRPGLQV